LEWRQWKDYGEDFFEKNHVILVEKIKKNLFGKTIFENKRMKFVIAQAVKDLNEIDREEEWKQYKTKMWKKYKE
jgi:hypothetical protein